MSVTEKKQMHLGAFMTSYLGHHLAACATLKQKQKK